MVLDRDHGSPRPQAPAILRLPCAFAAAAVLSSLEILPPFPPVRLHPSLSTNAASEIFYLWQQNVGKEDIKWKVHLSTGR
jgi:hypothetical protein